jgi:hypothetical protein
MNRIIIAAIIGTASLNAGAAGFAPWADAAQSAVQPAQDRAAIPAAGPFYRIDPPRRETPDAKQAEIQVKPWYLDSGV